MTNGKKYLKDLVDVEELIEQMAEKMTNKYGRPFYKEDAKRFFEEEYQKIQPTITADESVILRKMKSEYKYIGKKYFFGTEFLYVSCKEEGDDFTTLTPFDHLFQFIKVGEEYEIEELLK